MHMGQVQPHQDTQTHDLVHFSVLPGVLLYEIPFRCRAQGLFSSELLLLQMQGLFFLKYMQI